MIPQWILATIWSCVALALAQNDSISDGSYDYDPILAYRPQFTRSLPVQILLTGVIFTLVVVLFIQLIFTAHYHWPLAPINFVLQLSGVVMLLISLVSTLYVIFNSTLAESQEWPYMLSYVAVDLPPLQDNTGWTTLELVGWLLMNAITSALIQITHVQFLTLLFPSSLEKAMLFILLGPLAIVHAIMQLMPMHTNAKVVEMSDNISNVCNATLTLLFTSSLFIWGFLVNRKNAWRTDGGTAAFGAGAMLLAVGSTTLTFVYIPSRDQYDWVPQLNWAVVLWQSFMAWWWWVGAGMGVGEVEELLKREEKRHRKRKQRMEKRREQKERARSIWRGVTEAFGYANDNGRQAMAKMDVAAFDSDSETQARGRSSGRRRSQSPTAQSATPSSSVSSALGYVWNSPPGRLIHRCYLFVRRAHLIAARRQAEETNERKMQVYGQEGPVNVNGGEPNVVGWGLGSFGVRGREAREHGSDSDDDIELEEVVPTRTGEQTRAREDAINGVAKLDNLEDGDGREMHRTSLWWRGPLRQWRLRDSTVY